MQETAAVRRRLRSNMAHGMSIPPPPLPLASKRFHLENCIFFACVCFLVEAHVSMIMRSFMFADASEVGDSRRVYPLPAKCLHTASTLKMVSFFCIFCENFSFFVFFCETIYIYFCVLLVKPYIYYILIISIVKPYLSFVCLLWRMRCVMIDKEFHAGNGGHANAPEVYRSGRSKRRGLGRRLLWGGTYSKPYLFILLRVYLFCFIVIFCYHHSLFYFIIILFIAGY